MSDYMERAVLGIVVDASGAESSIANVNKMVDSLGKHAQDASGKATDSFGAMASGSVKMDRAMTSAFNSAKRQLESYLAEVRAGIKSFSDVEGGIARTIELAKIRNINTAGLSNFANQIKEEDAALRRLTAAAAATNPKVQQLGKTQKELAFAMRGMPAQITDIVVSLQSGQRPLTVLLQQGGQIKDMFGGVGMAAKALGTYIVGIINPFTIAATVGAALAAAYYAGSAESDRLKKSLILTGNSAGTTAEEMTRLAKQAGVATGNISGARDAAEALAASGKIAASMLPDAMRGITAAIELTGKSAKDLVADFESIAKDPVEAAKKLNEQYNFLTIDIYRQIKAIQEQGRTQESAELLVKQYADTVEQRSKQVTNNLGYIEIAWNEIKAATRGAIDAMMDIGRVPSLTKELGAALAELHDLEVNNNRENIKILQEQARERVNSIREKIKASKAEAEAEAASAKATQDRIAAEDRLSKYTAKHPDRAQAIAAAEKEFQEAVKYIEVGTEKYNAALRVRDADIKKINESYRDKSAEKAINQQERAYTSLITSIKSKIDANKLEILTGNALTEAQKMQIIYDNALKNGKISLTDAKKKSTQASLDELKATEQESMIAKALKDEYEKHKFTMKDLAADYKLQISLIGKTNIEQQKLLITARVFEKAEREILKLRRQGVYAPELEERIRASAREAANAEIADYVELEAAGKSAYGGLSKAVNDYLDNARDAGKQLGDAFTNAMSSAEDAWVQFVQTGKLSFKGLINSLIADMARMQFQSMTSSIFGSSGLNLAGMLGGLFSVAGGGGSGLTASSSSLAPSLGSFQGFALGGPVTAGTPYMVGERGAELFVPTVSGNIVPNDRASGGISVTSTPIINIDSRTDQATVRTEVMRAVRAGNAELVSRLERQRRI